MPLEALALSRAWVSTGLPGYREPDDPYVTYSAFDLDALPPITRPLDVELRWLLEQPQVEDSLADDEPPPGRPAIASELDALIGTLDLRLPAAFETFVRDPAPRTRVRSPTACYLDLGEHVVAAPGGGWLVHFLSDQQWVCHWLLYVDTDGTEAVVATGEPYGFGHELSAEQRRYVEP
ncbi:hypothetical protein OJ997_03740 [Solirubrobacter phytolaccae]|uniref:Uncharacterized protein n=1 Tax=Solirubrobacter phytolaccae TaxID=1404360 RepID=A0A9X3NB18_9ACTN|nr:hypothetical protein [Solirubrobacter phytolaccae]MDA0179397.1 hypothetical protein [Solirubrobacter phytolaccae]